MTSNEFAPDHNFGSGTGSELDPESQAALDAKLAKQHEEVHEILDGVDEAMKEAKASLLNIGQGVAVKDPYAPLHGQISFGNELTRDVLKELDDGITPDRKEPDDPLTSLVVSNKH